jgi:hydroxypyruvate reductase
MGGETTVVVKGKGKGGRNQEFAVGFLQRCVEQGVLVENMPALLSAGTDGIDGPTDAAGGFADSEVLTRMKEQSLDPNVFLDDNNTYEFLKRTGGLFITGPTGTNVADIALAIIS